MFNERDCRCVWFVDFVGVELRGIVHQQDLPVHYEALQCCDWNILRSLCTGQRPLSVDHSANVGTKNCHCGIRITGGPNELVVYSATTRTRCSWHNWEWSDLRCVLAAVTTRSVSRLRSSAAIECVYRRRHTDNAKGYGLSLSANTSHTALLSVERPQHPDSPNRNANYARLDQKQCVTCFHVPTSTNTPQLQLNKRLTSLENLFRYKSLWVLCFLSLVFLNSVVCAVSIKHSLLLLTFSFCIFLFYFSAVVSCLLCLVDGWSLWDMRQFISGMYASWLLIHSFVEN